jgi:hypothetical protein
LTLLSNGNFVVTSEFWNGFRGAVTWGSESTGVSGIVSDANSLVGSNANDRVGTNGVIVLSNGNYVVRSQNWNGNRGAATWGSDTTGVSGVLSDANSLVGSNPGDLVGGYDITRLSNGNYVVTNLYWNDNRGAVTWGSGGTGVSGIVSDANSLVGSSPGDRVGYVVALSNGNYVVSSSSWNGNRGAVILGSGITGVSGTLSDANSLVGSNPGDGLGGYQNIIALSNGNYLVSSPNWNSARGAATWGSGTAGVTGAVSSANSLIGSSPGDGVGYGITRLSNGNYVVRSPAWNGNRGAATWGSGTAGVSGVVSEANSLVGSDPNDQVGNGGITPLSNGDYVVGSRNWNGQRGAATWGSGTTGVSGTLSEANSLVGSNPGDGVGDFFTITPLSNGSYVVSSTMWNGNRGAVTWGSGGTGVSGFVSEANSLVGSNPNDRVGDYIIALSNSNYLVRSPNWNGNGGAVTWGSGTAGVSGVLSDANSLVGSNANDRVGLNGITLLTNGNYLVGAPGWNGNRGAVTWGSGTAGVTGAVSGANSLVGSNADDQVGYDVTLLGNGNYLVRSPNWNGNRGAVTWGSGTAGVSGVLSDANSLVGSNANEYVGSGSSGITVLSSGNYLVRSPNWNGSRGAVTWVSGTTGQTFDGQGTITAQNSLLGRAPNAGLGIVLPLSADGQSFLAPFTIDGGGRVTVGLTDPNLLTYALGQAQTITITPAFLTRTLNTSTAVVLQASNDITVNDPLVVQAGGLGGALTLQAGRSILLNASITTDNGDLTLIANDTLANGVVDAERDPGAAVITMADGVVLDTGTGALTVELRDGAGLTNSDSGAVTLQAVTAGSVSVSNNGPSPDSDVILGPVTTAGPQNYTAPHGTTRVTGNLIATGTTITFTDAVAVNDGLTIDAGAGTVNFAGSGLQTLQSGGGATFANVVHTGSGTLQLTSGLTVSGSFTNAAGTFDANDQAVSVAGPATVADGTYLAGTAAQTFAQGLLLSGGTFRSSAGAMTVSGAVTLSGGQLGGVGTVGPLTAGDGAVAAGPGVLTVAGSLVLSESTTFQATLNGTDVGSYSQVQAGGPIDLGGSTLSLILGFTPDVGDRFTLLRTDDASPITGTFAGLDEGAEFDQDGLVFQITYQGGPGGNSVVLTRLA